MISIWEKESFISFDVIIVGAGISGLSTAASLKEMLPKLNILVLERGLLPTGASTKNAGFACFGSISELSEDRKSLGDDGMLRLVEKRWKGLQKTTKRLGAENIGLELKSGFELIDESTEKFLNELDETNTLLKDLFDQDVFSIQNEKIEYFGFHGVKALVQNRFEGQLHTGKLIKSLWQYCNQLGIQTLTGAEVTSYQQMENFVLVHTKNFEFECKSLAICTNAFAKNLLPPDIQITPGRGLVMLLKPKQKIKFEGTFHYQNGYYYFRDFQDKIIFGGGRNLDFIGETTTEFGLNEKIESQLHQYLKEVIIPDQPYDKEMIWSGIMAFGENKEPIVTKISNRIYAGVRLGGMGVAIGSMVGEDLASLIIEKFK